MFENLTERLSTTFKNLRGIGRLTEANMQTALDDVRSALLNADVALPVVTAFIERVREKAIGHTVLDSINPGQAVIKIVHDEMIILMGGEQAELDFTTQPPAVFLVAGLQGTGKTTSVAKLGRYLQERTKKKVLLCSADTYRPAAITQLQRLCEEIGVDFMPSDPSQSPIDIAKTAVSYAKQHLYDVLILDTAGRLAIDQDMMTEIKQLHEVVNPIETLLVVDSMTGQDAANTAKAFHDVLPLTGIILTKIDGDARGGAALSVRHITGKPIKFIGTGEKTDCLEPFHPDRMASRILGMGDILSLVEEAERKVDRKQTEKFAKKVKQGQGFDLQDYQDQLQQMNNMGGMMSMLGKIPGLSNIPQAAMSQVNDKQINRTIAMINSMTRKERRRPEIILGSRKKRIALGSGTDIQDVNRLLKQFKQMQKMMKKMTKPGMLQKMMRNFGGMVPPR